MVLPPGGTSPQIFVIKLKNKACPSWTLDIRVGHGQRILEDQEKGAKGEVSEIRNCGGGSGAGGWWSGDGMGSGGVSGQGSIQDSVNEGGEGAGFEEVGVSQPQQKSRPAARPSPVAGEPQTPQRKKYQFGPEEHYSAGIIPEFMQAMQAMAEGGIVKDFTPDHALMFALGAKYGLGAKDSKSMLDKTSRSNPMPP